MFNLSGLYSQLIRIPELKRYIGTCLNLFLIGRNLCRGINNKAVYLFYYTVHFQM